MISNLSLKVNTNDQEELYESGSSHTGHQQQKALMFVGLLTDVTKSQFFDDAHWELSLAFHNDLNLYGLSGKIDSRSVFDNSFKSLHAISLSS